MGRLAGVVRDGKTIKIAVPHNTVTGGIELLHQVGEELNRYEGITAELWYMYNPTEWRIPTDYLRYGNVVNNDVKKDDILIFPEIWANYTNFPEYRSNKKFIYWEGVDAYFFHTPKNAWYRFGENTTHISQSEYSNHFVLDVLNVEKDRFVEISDYINEDFLGVDIKGEREPIVLYNPTKGMDFTEKLIEYAKDITFLPIKNMGREEIIELMKRSMVWIDFGHFPGKDRLPREAGSCGMCLITSRKGTARYEKDLCIPECYKMPDFSYADLATITDLIKHIFSNFEAHQNQFELYRERIKGEKRLFKEGIKRLVEKL